MVYLRFLLHTDYSGTVLTEPITQKEFKKGTIAYLNPISQLIYIDTTPICHIDSFIADHFFCRDNDGLGELRHKLTYAIAFSKRQRIHRDGTVSRLTEEETDILKNKWFHFIKETDEVLLFNSNFFNAEIDDLKRLANDLHIKVNLEQTEENKAEIKNDKVETKIINNIQISTAK